MYGDRPFQVPAGSRRHERDHHDEPASHHERQFVLYHHRLNFYEQRLQHVYDHEDNGPHEQHLHIHHDHGPHQHDHDHDHDHDHSPQHHLHLYHHERDYAPYELHLHDHHHDHDPHELHLHLHYNHRPQQHVPSPRMTGLPPR